MSVDDGLPWISAALKLALMIKVELERLQNGIQRGFRQAQPDLLAPIVPRRSKGGKANSCGVAQ
jgi:hypothetical protein